MRKLNEVYWNQLSMWDFPPDNCIEKCTKQGGRVWHYILLEVYEVTSNNSWKTHPVTDVSIIKAHINTVDQFYVLQDGVRSSVNFTE